MVRKLTLLLALLLLCQPAAFAGLDGSKAAYMGGTSGDFREMKRSIEGVFDTTRDDELRFVYSANKAEQSLSIPYAAMVEVKYGRKPGMMPLFSRAARRASPGVSPS